MPYRVELARLRQCEADAVERAAAATDPEEQEMEFAIAAAYVVRITAIERRRSPAD
uniref:hypothetical protein n=1 Tax=uncultured Sphingomonas sp. TaxID=158754 RepID=UPI0035CA85DE